MTRELVFTPAADTSTTTVDAATTENLGGTPIALSSSTPPDLLPIGGPNAAVTFLTFAVQGVASGTVVNAQLVLTTPDGHVGPTGAVGVLPGVWIDETSPPLALAFLPAPAALTVTGLAATLPTTSPGTELAIDVTASVTTDGLVTFVLSGDPALVTTFTSRESLTPPRLRLTVQDLATAADDRPRS